MQPPAPADDTGRGRAKLRWRCRRGMKELDLLLLHYLEHDYPLASPGERAAFERLLDLQDPQIFGYLVGREFPPDDALRHVFARIQRDR